MVAHFDAADELERLEWLVLSSDAANPQRLAYLQGVVTQRRASRVSAEDDAPEPAPRPQWNENLACAATSIELRKAALEDRAPRPFPGPRATAAMRAADTAGVLVAAPAPRPQVVTEPTYSDLQGEPTEVGEIACAACSWLQRGTLGMTCPACSAAFTNPESAE